VDEAVEFASAILWRDSRTGLDGECWGYEIALPFVRGGGIRGSLASAAKRQQNGIFQFSPEIGCGVRVIGGSEASVHGVVFWRLITR
jgi:hypothetical protein